MEATAQLAAGICHDFNNTLTVIGGCVEVLAGQIPVTQEPPQELADIRHELTRATALVQQLMLLSRRSAPRPQLVDLSQELETTLPLLTHLVPPHISLRALTSNTPVFVEIDPHELEQALMNLISNARDAMPDGGSIEIAVSQRAESALLSVADTGTGIPPQIMNKIFEPFFTTKEAGRGTGLGLASVRSIVARNGGVIAVCSTIGQGTRFTVSLPIAEIAA